MLKVLEHIEAKLVDKVFFKAETTVNIPTNAVIPIAIIKIVSMVRNNCVRIEPRAIRIFSTVNLNIISNLTRKYNFCYKFTLERVLFSIKILYLHREN